MVKQRLYAKAYAVGWLSLKVIPPLCRSLGDRKYISLSACKFHSNDTYFFHRSPGHRENISWDRLNQSSVSITYELKAYCRCMHDQSCSR